MKYQVSHVKGFSLLEILGVVVVAGIMLSLVVTGGGRWRDAAAQRAAVGQVAAAMDRARAHAIASGAYAAFAVAGADAKESAWRKVAVFAMEENPSGGPGVFPYVMKDGADDPTLDAASEPLDPVMPWMDLPAPQMIFGAIHGAGVLSLVDAPDTVQVSARDGFAKIPAKVVIFNAQGAVVYPETKALRVVRIGESEANSIRLLRPEVADALPSVTVERFTGRIRILR